MSSTGYISHHLYEFLANIWNSYAHCVCVCVCACVVRPVKHACGSWTENSGHVLSGDGWHCFGWDISYKVLKLFGKKNPRLELRVLFHKHHYKSMRTFFGWGREERIFLLWFLLKKEYLGRALYYEKLYFISKNAWGNDVLITWRPFIPGLLVGWRKLAWGLLMLPFSENAYPNSSVSSEGGRKNTLE